MYLLVIGLVAVIVAFLVAAFFSMRRRHDDEDEPARRPGVRDKIRGRGDDARGRDARWDSAGRQRPPARRLSGRGPALSGHPGRDAADPGRTDRYERAGYDQSRGYEPSSRGYGERTPIRGYEGRGERTSGERTSARRSPRYDDATATVVQSAARPARSGPAAPSARRGGDDSFGTGPVTALYDTGPSGAAPEGYATVHVNADPDLADSDVFPRVREDMPRPASKGRQRNQPKSRGGRPSRNKHDDDDDWPSTEWDKLSDEQYWAELSADKPLATTARSAQSSRPVAAKPARGPAATADGTDRMSSTGSRRSRGRAGQDDATQQLDARQSSQASRSGGRAPAARPRGGQGPEAGDRATQGASSRPGGRGSGRPAPGDDYEVTGRVPSRSRSRGAADMPASAAPAGTGPMSTSGMSTGPMSSGPMSTGPMSAGPVTGPIGPRPASPAPASPAPSRPAARGPVGEDPLTSPAYARPTSPCGDSRSYRKSTRAGQPDPARAADEPRGYPHGSARADYPAAATDHNSYPGTGSRHRYPATPPPYDDGRPAETTSPQAGAGNPYGSFVDSAPPPRPETTGPTYPPAAPRTGSQGSYGGQGSYPNPYGPGRDGYPAASHGRHDQAATYYSAPPPAAAAQPAAAYPYPASPGGYQDSPGYPDSGQYGGYQNGGGYPASDDYPGSNGYSAGNSQPTQPGQAGYGSRYAGDSQPGAQYPGGPGTDPYGPDGYGGYHYRQG